MDGVEGAVEGARGGGAEEVAALEGVVEALGEGKGKGNRTATMGERRRGEEDTDAGAEDAMDLS